MKSSEGVADDAPNPCDVIPNCPVCSGVLTMAHAHANLKICVCKTCGTSLTIPDDAWIRAEKARRTLTKA